MEQIQIDEFSQKLKRKPDSHKYDFGHILVIAGSKYMPGAGVLCCNAVLRSGAGLVTYAVTSDFFQTACAMSNPETLFFQYESTQDILDYIKERKISSLIIGPGLVADKKTRKFVLKIISKIDLPVILDASAITSFEGRYKDLQYAKAKLILTPHEGEFSKLTGQSIEIIKQESQKLAVKFATQNNLICVLKKHRTIVANMTGDIYVNDSGTAAMASAGSGDVLSGIVAALCGANEDLFEATTFAVWIHGLAGQRAQKEKGNCLIASDIVESIPYIIKQLE